MALPPRYERTLMYQPTGADTTRAAAAQELASTLGQVANLGFEYAGRAAVQRGTEQGAQAGVGVAAPRRKAGFNKFAQAYNAAALTAHQAEVDTDIRENMARIADEARNDSALFDQKVSGYLEGLSGRVDPTLKQSVENDIRLRSGQYRQKIIEGERQRNLQTMFATMTESAQSLSDSIRMAARDGNTDILGVDLAKYVDLIGGATQSEDNPEGLIEPAKAAGLIQDLQKQINIETIYGDFTRNLQKRGVAVGERYVENISKAKLRDLDLTPEDRDRLINKMEADVRSAAQAENTRTAVNKSLFTQRVQDEVAMLQDGIEPPKPLTKEDFVNTYGPEEGAYRYGELQQERDYGIAVQKVLNATPAEQDALLISMTPKPGEGYDVQSKRFEQMQRAVAQVRAAREKDPGAAAMRALSTMAEDASPEFMAAASLQQQRRWGVKNPAPLPKTQAQTIVASITQLTGDDAVMELRQMRSNYGKQYDKVFGQLLEENLPAPYVAIGAGMPAQAAALLASVANVEVDELKKLVPVGVPPKDIDDQIKESGQPYLHSFAGMRGGEKVYGDMISAAQRLAYRYASQGKTADEAAERAWSDVIGHKYDFRKLGGETLRIPLDPNKSPGPVDSVIVGLDRIRETMQPVRLAPPEFDLSVLGDGEQMQRWSDHVRNNGVWMTNEDDTGAYLMVDGALVLNSKNEPYMISFAEASRAAPTRLIDLLGGD